jgi:hypothetical protein
MTKKTVEDIGCASFGQEAGLEAIRMSLDGQGKMTEGCAASGDCSITWRPEAKRMIIMVTDEDSDLPTHA